MPWLSEAAGGPATDGMLYTLLFEVMEKLVGAEDCGVPPPLAEQLAEVALFLCAKIHQHGRYQWVRLTKLQVCACMRVWCKCVRWGRGRGRGEPRRLGR
jgi:hypothetical protein